MKTPQEYLDEVAKDFGYDGIVDAYNSRKPKYLNDVIKEAMQLAIEDATKEQAINCALEALGDPTEENLEQWNKIANAPTPTFKK